VSDPPRRNSPELPAQFRNVAAHSGVKPDRRPNSVNRAPSPGALLRCAMDYLSRAEEEQLQALRISNPFVEETLTQLERIYSSPQFERTPKGKSFLGFVVAKKLLGQADQIKETTIAHFVYHESADFNPAAQAYVRTAGADLRKRLAEYSESEGRNDPIEILIPPGGYVPEIRERRPAIAVSLFENWNRNGHEDHLCLPVSDEIAHQLMHSGAVTAGRVPSLDAGVERFGYGLRGSLECRGTILRLNASLSDFSTGQIICSKAFEGRRDDLLKLSRQIAKATVTAIQPEMVNHHDPASSFPRERFEALQLYQQGRLHLRQRTAADIRRAIELFEQAVEADGEYARAYSGLADCHLVLSWYELSTPDRVWFEAAKSHALIAQSLNPGLPEVHTSLGYATLLCDFDWAGAEEAFLRAIRINNRYAPAHHWYANLLTMQGRFDEAEEEMKRASHLDPGSVVIRKTVGDPYYYSRRYEQAIESYRAALKIDPKFWMAHLFLGWCYELLGDTAQALQEFEVVRTQSGMSSIVQGAIGHAYALSGREPEARLIIHNLQEHATPCVAPHTLGVICAGLGDKDRAFEFLEASYESRIELLAWIKFDPRFEDLHGDPRFDAFLQKLGLAALIPNIP